MGGAGVLPGVQITWWSELQVPFKSIIPLLSGQECGAVSLMFHYSSGVTRWYAGSWQIPLANQAGTKNAGEILLQGLYNLSFSSEPLPGKGLLCPKQCLALWGILMAERGCCWMWGLEARDTQHCSLQCRTALEEAPIWLVAICYHAWSPGACTTVPETPSPAPQILNRCPSSLHIYNLNHCLQFTHPMGELRKIGYISLTHFLYDVYNFSP